MKLIVAIIRPEKFEEVQDALDAQQVHLMSATDVPLEEAYRIRTGESGSIAIGP